MSVSVKELGLRDGPSWLAQDVNFEAGAGDVVAVVDAEGVARLALLLAVAGRMRAPEGIVRVNGVAADVGSVRELVGLGEIAGVNDLDRRLTVKELLRERVALVPRKRGRQRKQQQGARRGRRSRTKGDDLLARVGLDVPGAEVVEELSRLERFLFGAALGLAGDPSVLVVDGVDEGMDSGDTVRAWQALRGVADGGVTVLGGCLDAGPARLVDTVVAVGPGGSATGQRVVEAAAPKEIAPRTGLRVAANEPTTEESPTRPVEGASGQQDETAGPPAESEEREDGGDR